MGRSGGSENVQDNANFVVDDVSEPLGSVEPGGEERQWVLNARHGDLAAFERLVAAHQKRCLGLAYRLLSNMDDAMEVVQDAFLKAFDKLGTLAEPARFGPWLLRIVGNLALNRRRSRALRRTIPLDASAAGGGEASLEEVRPDPKAPAPDARMSSDDLQRLIQRTLDELPPMQRDALVLFSVQKLPQKEVAQMLGCSVEAVKWHVFTARKKLKERLKDYL
jgi:RNA polymerase sigma-70 factor (ECF subfamily)